jgi:hypothetical protein
MLDFKSPYRIKTLFLSDWEKFRFLPFPKLQSIAENGVRKSPYLVRRSPECEEYQ